MSKDLIKTVKSTGLTVPKQAEDAASRLKAELMADALGRMFGKDSEKPIPSGNPRVLLALANHGESPGWDRAKVMQRQVFEAAAGSGLEMKFAFYAEDNDEGVRRFKITTDWIDNADKMAALIDRQKCTCGCYVRIRSVLQQAVEENVDRPMRAVIIIGDAFHDDQDGLYKATLAANQLRRERTRVFFIQQGDDPRTARKMKYLANVSGGKYFRFDPKTQQQQMAEILKAVSAYAGGGEAAVTAIGGQAAIALLEHFKEQPMPPILDRERERIGVDRGAEKK